MNSSIKCSVVVAAGLLLVGLSSLCVIASTMPFSDDFESTMYTNGTVLNNTNGWLAGPADKESSVVSTANPKFGTQAARIGVDANLSNTFNNASYTNVWADFWCAPARYWPQDGSVPEVDMGSAAQFYIDTNGYLTIIHGSGAIYTNKILSPVINDLQYERFSVNLQYGSDKWAIFVGGNLVTQGLDFINGSLSDYKAFALYNGGMATSWLDGVAIQTTIPTTLVGDSNGDGMRDAWQIAWFGSTAGGPGQGATDNTDGDALNNAQESWSLTSPYTFDQFNSGYTVGLPFSDCFETRSPGQLYGQTLSPWYAAPTDSMYVVSGAAPQYVFSGSQALALGSGELSLDVAGPYDKVYTHMVLKPGVMWWANPTIRPDATVAFYVDTNGYIQVYNGSAWEAATNVLGGAVTNAYPAINSNDWLRCVVYSDYTAQKWSLWITTNAYAHSNELARLIAKDKSFNSAVSPAPQYFSGIAISNLNPSGGTGYLDCVQITTSISPWIDTDGDGIPDSWESSNGTDPNDPDTDTDGNGVPDWNDYTWGTTNINVGITNMDLATPSGSDIRLSFVVGADRTYKVKGSTTNAYSWFDLGSFYTGPNGETNWWDHTGAVTQYSRLFYVVESTVQTNTVTEDEVRAMYVQPRGAADSWYLIGVPVRYETGKDNLASDLGRQLALGLVGGNSSSGDQLYYYNSGSGIWSEYYLTGDGYWTNVSGLSPSSMSFANGDGLWVHRRNAGAALRNNTVFMGLKRTNTTYSVTLQPNQWRMMSWPYDSYKAESFGAGNTNVHGWAFYAQGGKGGSEYTAADLMVVPSGSSYKWYMLLGGYGDAQYDGRWWDIFSGQFATDRMEPGKGFFYYHTSSGAAFNWQPTE